MPPAAPAVVLLALLLASISPVRLDAADIRCPVSVEVAIDQKLESVTVDAGAQQFARAERVREFCLFHRLSKPNCEQIISEAERRSTEINCTQTVAASRLGAQCETISAFAQGTLSPHSAAKRAVPANHALFMHMDADVIDRLISEASVAAFAWLVDTILQPSFGADVFVVRRDSTSQLPMSAGAVEQCLTREYNRSTSMIVIDGDTSTSTAGSVRSYLSRAEQALDDISWLGRGDSLVGALIWNDFEGLFPTSIYPLLDFVLRNHYFSDQMVWGHVRWLPMGPTAYPVVVPPTTPGSAEPPIFVATLVDRRLFSCERGPASSGVGDAIPNKTNARCFSDWRVSGLLRGLRQVELDVANSSRSDREVRVYDTVEDLRADLHRISFLIALPAAGNLGAESRIMYDCLEHGCVPVVTGPTADLGLLPLGNTHTLPEVTSRDWASAVPQLLRAYVMNDTACTALQEATSRWWKRYISQTVGVFRHAVKDTRGKERCPRPGSHAFQHLLRSYRAWEAYTSVTTPATMQGELLQRMTTEARNALSKGLQPPPLKVFAFENIAAAHQIRSNMLRIEQTHGFQDYNRKALGAVSEALRVVLGDFSTERSLFPSMPKLISVAAALAWDLWAPHAGEWLTRQALRQNPMSAGMLEQLALILEQINVGLNSPAMSHEVGRIRERLTWVRENTYSMGVWIAAPEACAWRWWRGAELGWSAGNSNGSGGGAGGNYTVGTMKSMHATDAVDELLELMGDEDSSIFLYLLESEPLNE